MTPNDVKLVLQEVLGGGVFLNTFTFIIFVFGSFLAIAVAASAGAFFSKRGETAAVKRDLETIKESLRQTTRATEEIKAEITSGLWVEQNRWTFRATVYKALLESLGDMASAFAQLRFIAASRPQRLNDQDALKRLDDLEKEYRLKGGDAFERVIRATSVAGMWLSPPAMRALNDLMTTWREAQKELPATIEFTDKIHNAVSKAMNDLTQAARADLHVVRSTE